MAEPILPQAEIDRRLAEISAMVLPGGLRLAYLAIDDLTEQEVNPQSMPQKMFDQLIENVKSAGALESLPLCVKQADGIHIISGHHRVRAARATGFKHILALLYENLSTSSVKAKQLAHNTIFGKSDPELMKRVWEQITEVSAQFEAYVDPRLFKDIPQAVKFKPVDVDMQARAKTVVIVFLPIQKLDFDAAVEAIMPKGQVDTVYLANREVFDGWRQALTQVREDMEIVSVPVAVAEMARLAVKQLQSEKPSPEPAPDEPATADESELDSTAPDESSSEPQDVP